MWILMMMFLDIEDGEPEVLFEEPFGMTYETEYQCMDSVKNIINRDKEDGVLNVIYECRLEE